MLEFIFRFNTPAIVIFVIQSRLRLAKKLVEILPEVLKDSEHDLKLKEIMKIPLCPFFAS